MEASEKYDLVIVGTGVSGLAAAIYAGRYKLKVAAIGGEFGGATATAGVIWNYPGAKGVDGYELAKTMRKQAEDVGSEIIDEKVEAVTKGGHCFLIETKKRKVLASTVILAMGTKRRHLNLPNEKELTGKGVHYCVTCDGPLYGGKDVAIIGGGDASVKGAVLAAQYVNKIYLITMDPEFNAEPINMDSLRNLGDKVEIITDTLVKEIVGTDKLEEIKITKNKTAERVLDVDAMFVEIGSIPDNAVASALNLKLDDEGYIEVDNNMATNVAGVFASGDTVNFFGDFKQCITAAAMGSVAATSAYNYSKTRGDLCSLHKKPAS